MNLKPGQKLRKGLDALSQLFYPRLCLSCGRHVSRNALELCLACQHRLPQTNFHEHLDNPFTERLWGRVQLVQGMAFLYYDRGGNVQELIHRLKYDNQPQIGEVLGQIYGQVLKQSAKLSPIDLILPVPLHPRKQYERGYNQASQFAKGLSEVLAIPYKDNYLQRNTYSESQTGKTRTDRLTNVMEAFSLKPGIDLNEKRVLLVDDVMTTGATLEACAQPLIRQQVKLSMATIAMASH